MTRRNSCFALMGVVASALIKAASRRTRAAAFLTLAVTLLAASSVQAQTLAWNGGGGALSPSDGFGAWDTGANWWNRAPGAAWADGSDAVFGASSGTAGTVTIAATVSPNSITFAPTGDGNPYTITGGSISLDYNSSGSLPVIVNNNAAIGSQLVGTGGLSKSGTGILTLTNGNTYTGGTTISGGTLVAAYQDDENYTNNALGMMIPTNVVTINSGGVFTNAGGHNWADNVNSLTDGLQAHTYIVNSGGLITNAAGTITGLGNLTLNGGTVEVNNGLPYYLWNGAYILLGDVTAGGATASQITCPGTSAANIYLTSGTAAASRTFTVGNSSTLTIAASLIDGAYSIGGFRPSSGVIKAGNGTLVLTAANAYTGPTTVAGGTLQIGNGTSGEGLASPSITLSNNATLAFNHADGLSYGGTISGSGQLIKLGTGNLDLVGSGMYSGPTTISAGTLELDGNGDNLPAATALTIASSGVLDLGGIR